jgi:8-oxo-dGTP pyrophosphatase MutT (NUDIX family)
LGTSALHSVSVAAVITNEAGEVLMIQRRDNLRWEPPGGVLEAGESISEGLAREVQEETGYAVQPTLLTGVYKNMTRSVIALVFRAKIVESSRRPTDDEAVSISWLTPDDVVRHCDEAYAVRITDALKGAPPAIRAHDGVRLLAR